MMDEQELLACFDRECARRRLYRLMDSRRCGSIRELVASAASDLARLRSDLLLLEASDDD